MTSESGEQRDLTTKELREISRQMYLPKRAEKELKLLEAQLQDEESLFLNEGELAMHEPEDTVLCCAEYLEYGS